MDNNSKGEGRGKSANGVSNHHSHGGSHRHNHNNNEHRKTHHHRKHTKKSSKRKPCIDIGQNEIHDASENNRIPVTLETIDDCECPPPPTSVLQAQQKSHKSSNVSIPVVSRQLNAQGNSADTNYRGHDKKKRVNSSYWRSFANRINNRSRQVDNSLIDSKVENDISRFASTPAGDRSHAMHSQVVDNGEDTLATEGNDCVIPIATLVEEDSDVRNTPCKWKRLAIIILVASIFIAVGIGIGVAASKNNVAAPVSQEDDKRLSSEEIPKLHNYNVWFSPIENGGRAYYFGSHCNAIGTVCSTCGMYEVQMDTNEVTGECSYCRPCNGGGFEGDCTNVGFGKINCNFRNQVQKVPEGYEYSQWACPYEIGGKALCEGYAECNLIGTECKKCGLYEVMIDSNEVIGECSYCNMCAGGGVDADCTNVGFGKFNCFFPEQE